MKFTAAVVAALAAGASASYGYKNETETPVTYTTEVVTSLVTYCPEATTLTHGGKTYTVSEPTYLTITDCPCTVTKPVYTTPVVVCHTCGYNTTAPPPATTPYTTGGSYPTTTPPAVTAGAGKAATLSGAGLAAVLGLAALL